MRPGPFNPLINTGVTFSRWRRPSSTPETVSTRTATARSSTRTVSSSRRTHPPDGKWSAGASEPQAFVSDGTNYNKRLHLSVDALHLASRVARQHNNQQQQHASGLPSRGYTSASHNRKASVVQDGNERSVLPDSYIVDHGFHPLLTQTRRWFIRQCNMATSLCQWVVSL